MPTMDASVSFNEHMILSFQLFLKEEENLATQELAARQKVSELYSILDSEKSQSSVLRALLEVKESGELPGIFGRLGDLGAIVFFFISAFHICQSLSVSPVITFSAVYS